LIQEYSAKQDAKTGQDYVKKEVLLLIINANFSRIWKQAEQPFQVEFNPIKYIP